jgi:hypothetical protein
VNDGGRHYWVFTRDLIETMNAHGDPPWIELTDGKPITGRWLSQQLRRVKFLIEQKEP